MSCTPIKRRPAEGRPGYSLLEWYDRAIRSWTVIAVDADDYQKGDAVYCATKSGLPAARRAALREIPTMES